MGEYTICDVYPKFNICEPDQENFWICQSFGVQLYAEKFDDREWFHQLTSII